MVVCVDYMCLVFVLVGCFTVCDGWFVVLGVCVGCLTAYVGCLY